MLDASSALDHIKPISKESGMRGRMPKYRLGRYGPQRNDTLLALELSSQPVWYASINNMTRMRRNITRYGKHCPQVKKIKHSEQVICCWTRNVRTRLQMAPGSKEQAISGRLSQTLGNNKEELVTYLSHAHPGWMSKHDPLLVPSPHFRNDDNHRFDDPSPLTLHKVGTLLSGDLRRV